jgi:talin
MRRLQHAGNAVKRATDALVRSAQQAVDASREEEKYIELNTRFVGSMAQEIALREEILRKERELKAAQAAYNAVKKARYQRDEGSPSSSPAGSSTNGANQTQTVAANSAGNN